jgi:hypothetical protein
MSPTRVLRFWPLIALGVAGIAGAQTSNLSQTVEKQSRVGVWQPTGGGAQVQLWPEGTDLAKPDTGDRAEETGNGSALVAGRRWHWASYVTRPTMTIYRPKGRNIGSTMLVLPGGRFVAVAMDLEGTEICDWVVSKGMTCVVLKYRTPQLWPVDEPKCCWPCRTPSALSGCCGNGLPSMVSILTGSA